MAYGLRGLGSRSQDSSRGSHAPPGRARRSSTGQSLAGAWSRWKGRYPRWRAPQLENCSPLDGNQALESEVFGNGHASFGGGQGEKGCQSGTSPAAYPTCTVRVELRPFNDRALNRDLAILCERVNLAAPQLPDGRLLSFAIRSSCCNLHAQEFRAT